MEGIKIVLTALIKTDIRDDAASRLGVIFTHGAIGTDNTVPTAADTTLGAEVFRDTIDEFSNPGTGVVTASLRVLAGEANGNAIAEYGWLDAGAAGNLWTRNTITPITKTSDIQLFLDSQITISIEEI